MKKILTSSRNRGFTLIELMVVIGIIMFLFSLTLFPYGYYMQRAYVERVADTVGQEWILAHKEIRNGKLLQSDTFAHANTLLVFRPQAQKIEKYYFSGSIDQIGDMSIDRLQQLEVAPSIDLDSSIRILSFSGTPILDQDRPLGYIIQAPLGQGSFYTGTTLFTDLNMHLAIGYVSDILNPGKMRTILLRPYLQ